MQPFLVWALLTLLLAASAADAEPPWTGEPTGSSRTSIPLFSSSIFLAGGWDYLPTNETTGQSRCTDMVDRVAEYAVRQVQFVPTFYWVDSGPAAPPPGFDPTCHHSDLGGYYCYNRFNATSVRHWCYNRGDGSCPPVNASQVDQFVEHLGACMRYAVGRGLDIAVNARVDDGLSLGGWRNTLAFNPLQPYGNYSYLEAILYPLADAVAGSLGPSTHVDFEMQGEMGATAFFYPTQWVNVARLLRARLAAGAPAGWGGSIKVGLGMNNNKLCGCINIGITDAREYLGNFSTAFDALRSDFDLDAIQYLFTSVDFVGLSAYIPMRQPWFEVCELEGLMERFDQEAAYYNLSLLALLDHGVAIHWTEYGVGGGSSPNGDQRATTAEEAAYFPFWGVWGEYRCEADPWQLCYPDRPSPVRAYSRYFYNMTAAYLQQGGCQYSVDAVYIWGVNSWDIQAIYPPSTSKEGSYRDPVIADIINTHNLLALEEETTSLAAPAAAEAGRQTLAFLLPVSRPVQLVQPSAVPQLEAAGV